jgi:hypothetical protein
VDLSNEEPADSSYLQFQILALQAPYLLILSDIHLLLSDVFFWSPELLRSLRSQFGLFKLNMVATHFTKEVLGRSFWSRTRVYCLHFTSGSAVHESRPIVFLPSQTGSDRMSRLQSGHWPPCRSTHFCPLV